MLADRDRSPARPSSICHRAVDKTVVVTQVDQLPTDDRYGAGQVEYDLTGLDLTGRTASMGAQMGFGEIVVTVPRDMDVRLTARVGVGGLTLFGQESGGVNERIVRGPTTARTASAAGSSTSTCTRDSDTWRCVVRRHDTDVTSLVFGLIFVGVVGLWALVASDTMGLPDLSVLGPALLVVAGFIGLAATLGKSGKSRGPGAGSGRARRPARRPVQPSTSRADQPVDELAPADEPATDVGRLDRDRDASTS